MHFLITGGLGFLGSNIAKELIDRGHVVSIFDNGSRIGSEANKRWLESFGKFNFIHGDIRQYDDIFSVVNNSKINHIFHLSGQVAMTTSIANPRLDFETNALGSFNLLEALRTSGSNASVIYSSTNKVYGDLEDFQYEEQETRYVCRDFPNGFNEALPLNFHSPYGVSKGSADQYFLDYNRIYGIRTAVFRHSSMYGGRQFSTVDQGWVGWFTQEAIKISTQSKTTPVKVSGNGKQVRDLLFASDCVDLYLEAALNIDKISGKAYNIGGGVANSCSILELLAFLELELQIKIPLEFLPQRASDQKVFIAEIDKISSLLNWAPKVSKEAGIRKMIKWVGSQS